MHSFASKEASEWGNLTINELLNFLKARVNDKTVLMQIQFGVKSSNPGELFLE